MFGRTDIVKQNLTTKEMGKYLVLSFCFSQVSSDGDVEANFRQHINNTVDAFSEKYFKAGLLERPIVIDPDNAHSSLESLFSLVELSGQQIYLIVDECDSFVNRLLLSVDTSKPDLGLQQYEATVAERESMLRSWGNVIKAGTTRAISRAFFTGVVPPTFDDGLAGLNMVENITFDSDFAGLFGLTQEDVRQGLLKIDHLTPQQRDEYAEQMRVKYGGYRFVQEQDAAVVYNPQHVLYFLDHLDRKGVPPTRLVNPADSDCTDSVAKYIATNHKAGAAYTMQNFALGIIKPEDKDTFARDTVPVFRGEDLFRHARVNDCLVALAYFHGFLTYKSDGQGGSVLTSPNQAAKTVFAEALFEDLPHGCQEQLMAQVRSAQPNLEEIKRLLTAVVEAG